MNAETESVLERLVSIVRSERPQVMLGYDNHEWYPHPDHLQVHALSNPLFEAAADPMRFPASGEPWAISKLYAPIFSIRRLETIHRAMEERGLVSPYAEFLDELDRSERKDNIGASVDVGPYIEQARAALGAHRTQVAPDGPWFRVPIDLLEEVYPYEDFELLASRIGDDGVVDDLFAGVPE